MCSNTPCTSHHSCRLNQCWIANPGINYPEISYFDQYNVPVSVPVTCSSVHIPVSLSICPPSLCSYPSICPCHLSLCHAPVSVPVTCPSVMPLYLSLLPVLRFISLFLSLYSYPSAHVSVSVPVTRPRVHAPVSVPVTCPSVHVPVSLSVICPSVHVPVYICPCHPSLCSCPCICGS
jgi:hypothetical protein